MSVSSDEEDLDCPLCMEEIDITDRYFKPCPCGYQICRFCWNHIKENLNGLCPACRRPYSEDTVEFKPVPPEEIARIKAAKKKKERERKEQDQMSRRNLANARVVQKNLVYVLGLPTKIATEDILRGQDYFGQFGKIIRVVVSRRAHAHTPVLAQVPNTGVYITYNKKEDATRAIEAVDGSVYDGKIIRATYGTTKYCSYFLKNQQCQNPACQFLHEPGEEADAFAKDELSRMQVRERNPKPPPFPMSYGGRKEEKEESALPPTASWAKPVARPSGAQHYPTASVSSVSSTASATPRSPESDFGDIYTSTMSGRSKPPPMPVQQATQVDRKGKGKVSVTELPPGLAGGIVAVPDQSEIPRPEEEQVMGSSALADQQNETNPGKPVTAKLPNTVDQDVNTMPAQDDIDTSLSPIAMGFVLHPKYVGPFDPFRDDPLAGFGGSTAKRSDESSFGLEGISSLPSAIPNTAAEARFDPFQEGQVPPRSSSRASDNGQRSRFERFFGSEEREGNFEGGEKPKEDVKSMQEFRAMFPNVNVSFASGSLSEAEARWGESFSPSKLAVQDASGESWAQAQSFNALRSQQQQQAARGLGQYASANPLAMRQEQMLYQQQYLSQQQPLQPQHGLSQLQQLRLAQMQQQQQFSGVPHTMHAPPPEDLVGLMQLRESQQQLRELQLRAAAGQGRSTDLPFRDPAIMAVKMANSGAAAPGFEGRTRPTQAQSMGYQQDWPSPPGSSAGVGPAYGPNVRFGEWGSSIFTSKGDDAGRFDTPVSSGTGGPSAGAAVAGETTGSGSSGPGGREGRSDDGEGASRYGVCHETGIPLAVDPPQSTEDTTAVGEAELLSHIELSNSSKDISEENPGLILTPKTNSKDNMVIAGQLKLPPNQGVDDTSVVTDSERSFVAPSPDEEKPIDEFPPSNISGPQTPILSRPQTPVKAPATPPPKIGSPTPRRVLTITPSKKPSLSNLSAVANAQAEAASTKGAEPKSSLTPASSRARAKSNKEAAKAKSGTQTPTLEKDATQDLEDNASKEEVKTPAVENEQFIPPDRNELLKDKVVPSSPANSPKMKKRKSKSKVEETEKPVAPLAPPARPPKQKQSADPIIMPLAEPEIEAIVSRKTKKRKEKKIVVKQPPPVKPQPPTPELAPPVPVEAKVASPLPADFPESIKERLENLGLDFDKMSLNRTKAASERQAPARKTSDPAPAATSTLKAERKPNEKQVPTANNANVPKRVSQSPPAPPRRDSLPRKATRNEGLRHGEIDVTSFFTARNPQTGAVDMQIDSDVLANALSQLTAGYSAYANAGNDKGPGPTNVNVRIDVQGTPGSSRNPPAAPASGRRPGKEATASLDLSTLGINIGQLDQLAANLGNFPFAPSPDTGPTGTQGPATEGTVNVNVNGVPMSIDANAFIDQALEGLATTAAFLYEGLEAQAEKVRREEEMRNKGKGKGKEEVPTQTKGNMQRVADQVSKLEEYAAKLQEKVRNGLGPLGEMLDSSASSSAKKKKGKGPTPSRYTATFTVSANANAPGAAAEHNASSPSPISEMFGVGLNPATVGWTTEDWKAKCRSVEVVMKRVREAREIRRRQKEQEGTLYASGAPMPSAQDVTFQSGAHASADVLENGTDSDHEDSASHESVHSADDEQSITSSGFVTPADTGSPPADAQNLFENNYIQRLLETVRHLVSNGETLANTPSPALVASTAMAAATGKKKKKGNSQPQQHKCPHTHGPFEGSSYATASVGIFLDEGGRPIITADPSVIDAHARGRLELANVVAYNSHGEVSPVVFDSAPLLAAMASGTITPGMPIPWDMFGLRGPLTDQHNAESPGIEVHILERELEASRREEKVLEKQLVEIVRRNREWQRDVAHALEMNVSEDHLAGFDGHNGQEQYEDALEFDLNQDLEIFEDDDYIDGEGADDL